MQNSDNKKRVFGFVVLYGFETKNFFGSGLYEKIAKTHKVVVLRRDFPTKNFAEYVDHYDLDVTLLEKSLAKPRLKYESLYLASRRARQRLKKIENFNYFKIDRKKKLSDYILGNILVNRFLGLRARAEISKHYFDIDLEKIYKENGITDLIIAGYSSTESISLATTAKHADINIWLVINSWKDFYVNNLIPFAPTKTFVWSQAMKQQLLSTNSHIDEVEVVISGNPSFDRFFEYRPVHSVDYYANKYRFNSNCPLILYSMISPLAYDQEKNVIELINRRLIEEYPNEQKRPFILLRRNPIDETLADEHFYSADNVHYADNYFEGSYKDAVFVQLSEGEAEWMDLLYHASININVASTVTIESLMMKTFVINIEFNSEGNRDVKLSRYASAPFYEPLKNYEFVKIVSTVHICIEAIKNALENNNYNVESIPSLDNFNGLSVKVISRTILEYKNICI